MTEKIKGIPRGSLKSWRNRFRVEKKKRFFREVGVIPRFVFIIDITRRKLYYSTIKSLLQPNVSIRKEGRRKTKVAQSYGRV